MRFNDEVAHMQQMTLQSLSRLRLTDRGPPVGINDEAPIQCCSGVRTSFNNFEGNTTTLNIARPVIYEEGDFLVRANPSDHSDMTDDREWRI